MINLNSKLITIERNSLKKVVIVVHDLYLYISDLYYIDNDAGY